MVGKYRGEETEKNAMGLLRQELFSSRHRTHLKTLGPELFNHRRHLLVVAAGHASPGRDVGDEHDLALELVEGDVVAVDILGGQLMEGSSSHGARLHSLRSWRRRNERTKKRRMGEGKWGSHHGRRVLLADGDGRTLFLLWRGFCCIG